MFEKSGLLSGTFASKAYRRFLSAFAALSLALCIQGPVYATDPLEADPDPDFSANESTTMIVVDRLEDVDVESLSAGSYWIVATEENLTLKIQVQ